MTVFPGADGRLTPDAVQALMFPSARLGRRGFDEEHVRAFCRQVERELVRLGNERASLTDEVQRLRRRVLGLSGDEPDSGYRQDDAHVQAARILLSKAQETTDRYLADAQEYSRQLAQDARRRRDEIPDEILAQAKSRAALMLEEAHGEASRAAEAVLAAPVTHAATDRRELAAELAYLRTISDMVRAHLHAYLDTLARNVEEWEHAEQTSLAAARSCLPYHLHPQPQPPTG